MAKKTITEERLKEEIGKILPPFNVGKGGKGINFIVKKIKANFNVDRKEIEKTVKEIDRRMEINSYRTAKFVYYTQRCPA